MTTNRIVRENMTCSIPAILGDFVTFKLSTPEDLILLALLQCFLLSRGCIYMRLTFVTENFPLLVLQLHTVF